MAWNQPIASEGLDVFTDFDRMLESLQHILITPDAATETKLRTSRLERQKVATNLEHAREVLTELEREASLIRIQSQKQETQADLIQKRELLWSFAERLKELDELGEHVVDEDDSSDGEDLVGEDTPDDETETDDQEHTPPPTVSAPTTDFAPSPTTSEPPPFSNTESAFELESSGLRNRHNPRAELFRTSTTTTGRETATKESLMTHNRTEQETLTTSLLSMAAQLKQQSRAFAASLEDEKSVLERAAEGLDKNELGMEAAQRRMGFLRKASEGRGWLGRMLMYAYIMGLAIVAFLVVFVMPKLRF